jgi:hypothetical protein
MKPFAIMLAAWTWLLVGMPPLLPEPAAAQGPIPRQETSDWGDYPLLMSQFGELCTKCVAYLRCIPDDAAPPVDDRFALYYFETKDFWGQIATIWDYFAKWFNPVTSESRPATVYRNAGAGERRTTATLEAYLDVKNARIEIDGTWIDRDTSVWYALETNERIGQCHRPSIEGGVMIVEQMGPWQSAATESAP